MESEQRPEAYRSQHPSCSKFRHPSRPNSLRTSPVQTERIETTTIPPILGQSQDERTQRLTQKDPNLGQPQGERTQRLTQKDLNQVQTDSFSRPQASAPVQVMGDGDRTDFRDTTSSSNHSADGYHNTHWNEQTSQWQQNTMFQEEHTHSENNRKVRPSLGHEKATRNTIISKKYESDADARKRLPVNQPQFVTI
jgi:hypothetical protein